ncbi:hypothetical protein [Cerasicoccus frondis]|uniref:hypothetical protein n=1 Tax=Cerasicoccus frondis TaxID=490090 RepID=UPI0028528F26|nr:hypothetical protein [Cerasicoccus frondis]
MKCPHYGLVPKSMDANLLFRRDLLMMASTDPSAAKQIKQMCAEDLLFYVNAFCWTYDPRCPVSRMPFITYPEFQDDAMLSIVECVERGEDFSMPKSRDMGASWIGLTVFEWFWHFRENLSFLLISRNEDYVDKRGNPKSLFWKIDFLHENQPRWLLPDGRWQGWKDPNRKMLHLANAENKSVIDGESTTGDAGRGDRRTAMFIDEHAAFELNDGFRVLRATRDTTKCRGFNSTPQGANNGFYEVVHKTAARQIRLHWSKHPEKNKGLYTTDEQGNLKLLDNFRGRVEVAIKGEVGKRTYNYPEDYPFRLDKKLRSPWYDNECARCVSEMEIAQELDIDFLGSDYQFFDNEFIELYIKRHCESPVLKGRLEYDDETLEPKRFVEDERGDLWLWNTLSSEGRPPKDREYVMGTDVSAGTGASNSVSCVVDRNTGEKVAVLRTPHLRPNPFAGYSIALGKFFNKAFKTWDASGPTGKVYTQRVIKNGYGNVYYRRAETKVTQDITSEPGYYLNPKAREAVLEDYREALSKFSYINRSEMGMRECMQFIRKPDGTIEHSASANSQDPSGARTAHGDEVIADALACLGLEARGHYTPDAQEQEIPVGSLAWRMKQKADKEAAKKQDQLGAGW